MRAPPEPAGHSPLHAWLRRLRLFAVSLQIKPGVGYLVHQGTDGVRLEIQRRGAGASGETEIEICNPDTGLSETWRISGTRLS